MHVLLIDIHWAVVEVIEGAAGWRYLFSCRDRQRLNEELQRLPRSTAAIRAASLVFSFTFTLVCLVILVYLGYLIVEGQRHNGVAS